MRDYRSDFAQVYRREIAPEAEALEEKRKKRATAFYRNIALSLIGFSAIAGVAYTFEFYKTHTGWVMFAVFVGIAIAFGVIRHPVVQHKNAVKELVIPPICRMLGNLEYVRKPKGRFALDTFEDTGVVGKFNRSKLEDLFIGRYRETGFAMVEARLRRKRGRKGGGRTVFSGLLFDIEVPKPFTCFALMVGDKGSFGNMIISFVRERFSGLEKVDSGHPAFEARYELFSDDPAGALSLLSGGFFDAMVALSEAAGQKALNAAMVDQRFVLTLPHKGDLFEIGRLHRPLDRLEEDLDEIVRQITTPYRVIDYLHGDRPELMP